MTRSATAPAHGTPRAALRDLHAWIVTLGYLLVSGTWVAYSDRLGPLLFAAPEDLSAFQSAKGLLFVLLTSVGLFLLLRQRRPPAQAAPRFGSGLSIRMLLGGLVAGVALPLLAAALLGMQRIGEARLDREQQALDAFAQAAAHSAGERVAVHGRLLQLLVSRPALRSLDPRQCDSLLEYAVTVHGGAQAFTTDAGGNVVCGAASDGRSVTPAGLLQPALLQPGAWRTGAPERGADGEWRIALATAWAGDDGRIAGSVQLLLSPEALRPTVFTALDAQALAVIVDGEGTILVRSSEPERYLGQHVTPEMGAQMMHERSGRMTVAGPDGVRRVYAFRPVPGVPWIAAAGRPVESVFAGVRGLFVLLALGLLAAAGLAAWAAWVVGRRIGEPVLALRRVADRLAAGRLDARASEDGPSELAAVGVALNRLIDQALGVLRALQEREHRYRTLVDNAPDDIAVHENGVVTYANPRLRQMLGWSRDEAPGGEELLSLVQGEGRTLLARRLRRAGDGEMEAASLPLLMRRPDGQQIEVEHSCSSVREHGRIMVQSHFLDVTERNRAWSELERANESLEARVAERTEQLRAANEGLEAFSYSVAHDLRSPVGRVSGFAGALQAACADGRYERVPHFVERIVANVDAMDRMIAGLLELARAGRSPLELRPLDMERMVAEVLDELELPASLQVRVGRLPVVAGDAATLRQVWANLLSNAAKFSLGGPAPCVEVRAALEPEGSVRFEVTDNGPGFEASEADQLFQPFHRLAGAKAHAGTGLGLTIVKRVVERHGGRVAAIGVPGAGACFSFTLPPPTQDPGLRAGAHPFAPSDFADSV